MMNINNTLDCIQINPAESAAAAIIWLHGLGANGNDFTPIIPELNLSENIKMRFIFPNAPIRPVTINSGYHMPAWYDITSIGSERTTDTAGITQSINAINALIASQTALGIPSNKILLAGFSQGAAIAMMTFLSYPQPLAGLIALSGYLPMQTETLAAAKTINLKTPIYMAHGTEDMIVPYSLGKSVFTDLTTAGFNAHWHHYTMAHAVCQDEIQDIGIFINRLINKQ